MLHACFVRSPFARARIGGIDASEALALPGVHAVFVAADLNPDVARAVVHDARAGRARRRRCRRWPRTRCASSATRSRSSSPRAATSPRTRAELVVVDYEPLPAGRRLRRRAETPTSWCTTGTRQRRRRARRAARRDASTRCSPPPRTSSSETIYQQAYAAVPIETPGHRRRVDAAERRAHDLGRHAGAARGPRVLRPAARPPRAPHPRRSRDTGGGVRPEGRASSARRCASCWPRRKVPAAIKWIEDRRENLMAAGKSRHEHGDGAHGVRRRRHDPRRAHRLRAGRRRVPDAVAGRTAARPSGMLFPGPYRVPTATFTTKFVFTEHRRPHRVPRAVAVRVGRPRGAARHRGAPDRASTPSSSAAATCCAATSCRTRTRTACRTTTCTPLETFEHALEMLDYDAFRARAGRGPRRRAATSASARAPTSSRPRAGWASSPPRARRSASSRRARSTCTSPAGRPGTASRPRSCSSPPTRSASTSTTSPRSRATPRSRRSARAPVGAAAAR